MEPSGYSQLRSPTLCSPPTPQGSSYWKGSLQVACDYGRQLYALLLHLRVVAIEKGAFRLSSTKVANFMPSSYTSG